MIPAGETDLDLAQKQLAEVGVATDGTTLASRSSARAAYHDLITTTGWRMPEAITAPLTSWDFTRASRAIGTAVEGYQALVEASTAVPDGDALSSPIHDDWQNATTQADLDAVAASAKAEQEAADALAAAQRKLDQADLVATIGLLGTDPSPVYASGAAALRRGDATSAAREARALGSIIADAEGAGAIRLGLASAAVVGGAGCGFLVWRRRRASRTRAAALLAAPVVAVTSEAVPIGAVNLVTVRSDLEAMPPAVASPGPEWLSTLVSDPGTARMLLGTDNAVVGQPQPTPPAEVGPATR
ncbi:MAG TPA: hypothetical protein VGI98_06175 [Candidatus Limnocylindrales bacterium]